MTEKHLKQWKTLYTPEINKKRSETLKKYKGLKILGRKGGYKHSEETREKMSKRMRGKIGNKSPNWRGGLSFEPYSVDWTQTIKRSIRERDKYTCQVCGLLQCDVAFDIHHINYNKKNCNLDNLITLCRKCHMKTNGHRNYWIEYFKGRVTN
jgi:5-methylcytosine-specific restriction endonuclease McrA